MLDTIKKKLAEFSSKVKLIYKNKNKVTLSRRKPKSTDPPGMPH